MKVVLLLLAAVAAVAFAASSPTNTIPALVKTVVTDTRPILLDFLDWNRVPAEEREKQTPRLAYYRMHAQRMLNAAESTMQAQAELCDLAARSLASVIADEKKPGDALEVVAYATLLTHVSDCTPLPSTNEAVELMQRVLDAIHEAQVEEGAVSHATLKDMAHLALALNLMRNMGLHLETDLYEEGRLAFVVKAVMDLMEDDGTFRSDKDQTEGTLMNLAYALETLGFIRSLNARASWEDDVAVPLTEPLDTLFTTHAQKAGSSSALYFSSKGDSDISVTARLFAALSDYSSTIASVSTVTAAQVSSVARYLITRASPHNLEEVYYHVVGAHALSVTRFPTPLAMTVKNSVISPQGDKLEVYVRDVFGMPFTACPCKVNVVGGPLAPVLTQDLAFDSESGTYSLNVDVVAAKIDLGIFDLTMKAEPLCPETEQRKYIPIENARFPVQVMGEITFSSAEIKVDSKQIPIQFPDRYTEVIPISHLQILTLSFTVINPLTGHAASPHQSFIKFQSGTRTVHVVATPSNAGPFVTSVNIERLAQDFANENGVYAVSLIAGDSSSNKAIQWKLCDVELRFLKGVDTKAAAPAAAAAAVLSPQLPIAHKFQPTPSRVIAPIWMLFTGLALAPLAILIIALPVMGVNVKGMFFDGLVLWALVSGIAGVLVLYWLALTMGQCLALITLLGVPTFVMGLRALRAIHREKKD